MAKVWIETDDCIGCQVCTEVCPEVFDFDDDEGKASVMEGTNADADCVEEAIVSCPAECIFKE